MAVSPYFTNVGKPSKLNTNPSADQASQLRDHGPAFLEAIVLFFLPSSHTSHYFRMTDVAGEISEINDGLVPLNDHKM